MHIIEGLKQKLFNSELSFGLLIKLTDQENSFESGGFRWQVSLRRFLLPVNVVREWKTVLISLYFHE